MFEVFVLILEVVEDISKEVQNEKYTTRRHYHLLPKRVCKAIRDLICQSATSS